MFSDQEATGPDLIDCTSGDHVRPEDAMLLKLDPQGAIPAERRPVDVVAIMPAQTGHSPTRSIGLTPRFASEQTENSEFRNRLQNQVRR